ncbi:MAG: hypothetical protein WB660_28525, partial [Candidatus Sulfotelmatobacter sp.]
AGASPETIVAPPSAVRLTIRGGSNLVAYVGMTASWISVFLLSPKRKTRFIATRSSWPASASNISLTYFVAGGAYPLLWTTNLMAPEAYTLKSALDGWIGGENNEQIRDRATGAYDKYQKCGVRAARRLFATGW